MKETIYSVVSMILLSLLLTVPTLADNPRPPSDKHLKLDGEVTEIRSGLISVKTPVARYTIAANTAPPDAKVGDKVTLWLNQDSIVVDHHRQGTVAVHRFISGKLIYVGLMKKQIKLWTPEGEKVFPLERLEVKTGGIEEGAWVTVELNESGTVIDLHRANLEELAQSKDDRVVSHSLLDGEVVDIRSGLIFVKTPVARYTIAANTAPPDAKVGDKVTLWLNQDSIVIDHHRQGVKGDHRFITGKLIYVGQMKKQIKLWTPEGEKVFPLERLEIKTGGIEEGALVTVELNESGTVIDLHRADIPAEIK